MAFSSQTDGIRQPRSTTRWNPPGARGHLGPRSCHRSTAVSFRCANGGARYTALGCR
jgi:hypothetical protein